MSKYAKKTTVPVSRSLEEIRLTLMRFGADAFRHTEMRGGAMVEFSYNGRPIRVEIVLPRRDADEFRYFMRGQNQWERSDAETCKRWDIACRQKWREMALIIKAKLVAVQSEIVSFDDEFLPYLVTGENGKTVGQLMAPQIDKALKDGALVRGLLGSGGR